ncbi:LOW QUALITY PROTEIN: uncharacterized protein O3C94_004638 [Discoglossus pictus]
MSPYNPPEIPSKYIIFDFECMQETGVHIPNYIYSMSLDGEKSWDFQGVNCLQNFVDCFIKNKFVAYTFTAHNAGRYDSFFVVRQLIKEKLKISLLAQGGKNYSVTVNDLDIRFIDSLHFLPMKLSKLPKAMGFAGAKGHFPHFFNTIQNQNRPLPAIDFYGIDYMMPDEKNEFMNWYEENKFQIFGFQTNLKSYCQQDVEILREVCKCFSNNVKELTLKERLKRNADGNMVATDLFINPFQLTTFALVCMARLRYNFLPKNTVAIVPSDSYHKNATPHPPYNG